jgi:SpoVK/Ycf46/Vps4 family AAA+-type ATPase
MTTARQLLGLLKSHIDKDEEQFYAVALQLAAHEAKQGHVKLAQELREIIDSARSYKLATHQKVSSPIPLAQPKGDLANLVAVRYSDTRLSSMILPEGLEARLKRVLTEQRQQHKLHEHGLRARHKLLFVGPPGSGKTMTAAALAGELNLPLFTVMLDGLITKFMGETASKLRIIFEAMHTTKGIYFFDEFDALGAKRTERNDVGEIRRVLNSFLQFLEKDESDGLIVAATNHPELLDPALFRRFDDVIEYGLPDNEVALRLLKTRLAPFKPKSISWNIIIKESHGLSQAELVRATDDAAKSAILYGNGKITQSEILNSLKERRIANKH